MDSWWYSYIKAKAQASDLLKEKRKKKTTTQHAVNQENRRNKQTERDGESSQISAEIRIKTFRKLAGAAVQSAPPKGLAKIQLAADRLCRAQMD